MEFGHVLAFNVALIAAIFSPGPAMLYFIRQTIVQGRRTGLYTVMGLGAMAAAWTALALLGLEAVFALFPWAYVAFKTLGAAYLIWIAYQIWVHARAPLGEAPKPPARAFLGGVLVNLANPKSVLFAASVLIVIFPSDMALAAKGWVVVNHLVVEWGIGGALVMLISSGAASERYLKAKPVFDRVAALVLGGLGLRLLLSHDTMR